MEEYYNLIEDSTTGIDREVLMTLVKLFNKHSIYFRFRNSFKRQIKGIPVKAPLSALLANVYVGHLGNRYFRIREIHC